MRRLVGVVTLLSAVACAAGPTDAHEDSAELGMSRSSGMTLAEFTGYVRNRVAGRQMRVWADDVNWLTARWSWETGNHTFTVDEQRAVVKSEVLDNSAVNVSYIARIRLDEFVTGTADMSWQQGWPTGPIDLSERFNIGGSGHILGQHYDGGTIAIRVFGPDLDHLQAEVKGPRSFQSKSWLDYLPRGGHHFDGGYGPDGVNFQLLPGAQVAVYYYKSMDDSRRPESPTWGFEMGTPDFMPGAVEPVIAQLTHTSSVLCGDGETDMTEECDGRDLRGASCSSPGYHSTATPVCRQCKLDMSPCFAPSSH